VIVGPPGRIAFLGFGLIAGSIARALATGRAGDAPPVLVGWSPSNAGPDAAVRDGVLADVAPTIVAIAGLPRWPEMTGRSLLPD